MDKKNKNLFAKILTNSYVKTFALMFIIGCALIAITLYWLQIYTKHGESITVPSVRGLQIEEVENILSKSDLKYEVIDSLFLTDGIPGAVVEQTPEENAKVKKGRTIYITIQAKGVQMISIPNLKDHSQRQAISTLRSLGFSNVIIDEVPSAYKGLVIDVLFENKSLEADKKVPKGSPITLVVGAGGEQIFDSIIDYIPSTETPHSTQPQNGQTSEPDVDKSFF